LHRFGPGLVILVLFLGSVVNGQTTPPIESEPQSGQVPALARDTTPTLTISPADDTAAPTDDTALPTPADSWPKNINEISVDIRQTEIEVPDRSKPFFEKMDRREPRHQTWTPLQFSWQATDFWHRPLYFDDVPLERYGQMHHPLIQPWLSGVHFFGNVPLLPYKMGVDRPCDDIATLGYYRPGSAAPPVGRRLPLEADAATIEAATWVGLFLLLP
jgi:hypothetical protein